ncbi:MAG: ethanolamine ammonia-lyase reactivating factor EutA [Desulfoprunum sp.]|nr:ethanolamine ammonia-lyase reactivating factor EutA [Desulfoprunum sp.]
MADFHTSIIRSIGIDIGTTTTQFVLSRLTVKNMAPGTLVPRMEITDKDVIYRSKIHFTPIATNNRIDAAGLLALLHDEFEEAGVRPGEIDTGAVIITGETAKKENARAISAQVASLAGDFVVATAGGKLESIIAGKGSGAADYSRNYLCTVANIDIGGGTANIGIFHHGSAIDSCCINVGGRLLQVDPESVRIIAISQPMAAILAGMDLALSVNQRVEFADLDRICQVMATIIGECLGGNSLSELAQQLLMTEPLRHDYQIEAVMISGGVADYVYGDQGWPDPNHGLRHGDIGPLLGREIARLLPAEGHNLIRPTETIRATVIGAGARTVDVSGSTIMVDDARLPLKNIPVALPFVEAFPADSEAIREAVTRSIGSFFAEHELAPLAIGVPGSGYRSFADVQALATGLSQGLAPLHNAGFPLIVIVEADLAKVLGQSLRARNPAAAIICIDQLQVKEGDYIDIGRSIAGGTVVPVVIKSLIFETRQV